MFVIAANNGERAQLPWLATFISFILQDVFFLPILNSFLQTFLVKYKKRNSHRKNSLLKKLMIERVDPNFEKVVVKIFLLNNFSLKFLGIQLIRMSSKFQPRRIPKVKNQQRFTLILELKAYLLIIANFSIYSEGRVF